MTERAKVPLKKLVGAGDVFMLGSITALLTSEQQQKFDILMAEIDARRQNGDARERQ